MYINGREFMQLGVNEYVCKTCGCSMTFKAAANHDDCFEEERTGEQTHQSIQ